LVNYGVQASLACSWQRAGFASPAQPLSRLLRSTGNFSQKRNPWVWPLSLLIADLWLDAKVDDWCAFDEQLRPFGAAHQTRLVKKFHRRKI
jgi:hypothetical protein